MMPFKDRRHGGQALAALLAHYQGRRDVIVLALPRGGVPVAYEVARSLPAPLDVFVVRKLGFPGQEEYAMGAIASGGVRVMNPEMLGERVPEKELEAVVARETEELARRELLYRGRRPSLALEDRTVILVDDGLATGATMRAATLAVRQMNPARIVVAAPVAAPETCLDFQALADEVVCARTPSLFRAVGLWYEHFPQTSDDEVRKLLDAAWAAEARRGA